MEPKTLKERIAELDPKQIVIPLILLIVLLGTIIGIYNYSRKLKEQATPNLTVNSPSENQTTVTDQKITVEGKTDPGDTVTINGETVPTNTNGDFNAIVNLNEGENTLNIDSTNKYGKKAEVTKSITKTTPAPAPVAGSDLSSSGPETFWLGEAGLMSGAAAAWYLTKKKLTQAHKK